jgi:hypothetical protein
VLPPVRLAFVGLEVASPDVLPPLLLWPPLTTFVASDELPPELPPTDAFVDVTLPPVWLPDAEGLPPEVVQLPPLLHVSAELPALPLVFEFRFVAFPPFPDASPAFAVPPFALAGPLVADAPLWSTEAFWFAFTLTVTWT